ncbi:Peptidase S1 PA clan [Arabidopsis thaliana x Arabidopsis arenosa]|uniref:Peptidase S1 PA clan n=1 Tax=Arabidopsis thaliana x Arabidopsis arenosa TaxID=1240361 RepID=A0A8T1YDJ3_9BRAS|nr:Peptidase S1 PA clan [Arabidopsis thaliana x Arabidopsis arenosa]
MSFWSFRGRINLVRLLRTNRIFTGVLSDFASLFRFLPPSVAAEKTIDSVADESVLNSVVKIYTFSSKPNICYPWQTKPQKISRGSGFVIPGKMIITNAHVVDNHILVLVIKHGSPKKYKAEVKAIGHDCDLAILVIESKEFWEDMNPLELGDMPFLQQSVNVIGYPKGGENISVTKGVVSRLESKDYVQGATNLPVLQTDAAMNFGNSGGPVCIGNKVVGVAFQSLRHSNNIGYLIPAPVVKHFIAGVEKNGRYVGFCSLNLSYQPMDAHFRSHFKMNSEMTGILIYNINQHSDALNILKKYDVILAIDGVAIENDGTVILPNRERIRLDNLVSMKQFGETILLKILREGKMHEFNITLKQVQRLVPAGQFDNNPSYYIFAGFVFVTLRKQHIKGSNVEQIVIISEVLADVINVEYYMFKNLKVNSVNKVKVENLKHLCELIEKCCTKDLRLELGDGRVIILDYQSAKSSTSLILERHRVPSAMSKDLMIEQSKTCLSTRL